MVDEWTDKSIGVAFAQRSFGGGGITQAPAVQTIPAVHAMPHDPQLALSVWRFAHEPEPAQ